MCLYACLYFGCVQGAAPAPTQLTFDNAYNFHGSGHVMGAAVSPMQEFNVQLSAPAHHPFGLHHDTGAGQTRPASARYETYVILHNIIPMDIGHKTSESFLHFYVVC